MSRRMSWTPPGDFVLFLPKEKMRRGLTWPKKFWQQAVKGPPNHQHCEQEASQLHASSFNIKATFLPESTVKNFCPSDPSSCLEIQNLISSTGRHSRRLVSGHQRSSLLSQAATIILSNLCGVYLWLWTDEAVLNIFNSDSFWLPYPLQSAWGELLVGCC